MPRSGTNYKRGIKSRGVPVLTSERMWGNHYFVNPNTSFGSDSNTGRDKDAPFLSLTQAFAAVGNYDVIHCAPGNYTGNYETPLNADAAFVSVIADATHENGLAAWMGATTASSPIIDVRARGWSFMGFEFDCPTGAAAIRLSKSVDGSTQRCDFTSIGHCIFTTGKLGIQVAGGGTHVHVFDNKFDQLTTSGAFAISVLSTGNQIPAFWVVEDNIFATSLNHIGPANATYGWNESIFRRNVHQSDSGTDVTAICDVRASGGTGNMILDNYFDIAKAAFTASTAVRGNTTDYAAGNHFLDGEQQEAMNVS